MADSAPQVEWYIARDGAQHGPISDVEMRKFVELGHLRPTDLVWCARFTDWRPGAHVFPELAQVRTAPPAPAPGAYSSPGAGPGGLGAMAGSPAGTGLGTISPGAMASAGATAAAPARTGPGLGGAGAPAGSPAQSAALSLEAMAGALRREPKAWDMQARPEQARAEQSRPTQLRAEPLRQQQAAPDYGRPDQLRPAGISTAVAASGPPDEDWDDEPARRPWVGRAAAAVAAVLIIGGLGWVGWHYRSMFSGVTSIGSAVMSTMSTGSPGETYQVSPYVIGAASTQAEIDAALQRSAIWRVLKRDFAEWYNERLADVERMRAQKQDENVVSKFLADVIVVLRRRHGQSALHASPDHLRSMSGAFLANLRQLSSRDAPTCFGFISYGEAHLFMMELSRTPAFAEALQRQMVAIFEAIADGRKNRQVHASTRRTDYEVLTAELTQRGWSSDDLTLFSNPQRLSSSPPEKVCRMVQDWFTAQLALKDQELQTRLLAESLKPLVFG